ncbi:MAG: 16S rRNA (guanine(527)-N(7))-methyltransferase RsmG [Pseudomonadota bacterium]
MTRAPDPGSRLANVDVSRETRERLEIYARLLQQWNQKINLVSNATVDNLWTRHFADSLQVFAAADAQGGHWADLGSGGGFPGMVVAVAAQGAGSEMTMTLVESDQRKAAFLRTVSRETSVAVDIRTERIEDLSPLKADILSARALAPLTKLLVFSERHLRPDGMAIFPKGARYGTEVEEARNMWAFDCETVQSCLDPNAVILKIGDISRV